MDPAAELAIHDTASMDCVYCIILDFFEDYLHRGIRTGYATERAVVSFENSDEGVGVNLKIITCHENRGKDKGLIKTVVGVFFEEDREPVMKENFEGQRILSIKNQEDGLLWKTGVAGL